MINLEKLKRKRKLKKCDPPYPVFLKKIPTEARNHWLWKGKEREREEETERDRQREREGERKGPPWKLAKGGKAKGANYTSFSLSLTRI